MMVTGSAAAAATILIACGGGSNNEGPSGPQDASGLLSKPIDTTKQAKRGGILKNYTNGDGNLDPNVSVAGISQFLELIYTRLVTLKPGHFSPSQEDEIAPDMAESWEYSPDRLQITLKLRPGVRFHNLPPVNGRLLDVDDVVFSWKRFESQSVSRAGVANAANPDAPVLSLTAPDSRTVVIKLREPIAYALNYFVNRELVNIMPKEAGDPGVLDLRSTYLGAGVFSLGKYEPSVGFMFKKNPEFWDKSIGFIDQLDYPIITEYAQGMAQLRAGNIYLYAVRPEDVLQLKRDVPAINMYAGDIAGSGQNLLFGRRTPAFRDERVRLAFQMSYDRETWIDTLENAAMFDAEGLPVERSWYSAFPGLGHALDAWRPDPRDSKAFGPNAQYYQHDVAEAKKLLAAAGFPNGLEVMATAPSTGAGSGITTIEARQSMNGDAGLKFKTNLIPYQTDFIPNYRDARGDFEGIAYKGGIEISGDIIDRMCQCYWSKSGVQFYGFDSAGRGDASGDPYVDSTLVKARTELDTEKRKALSQDLQRYLAAKAYGLHGLGGATRFSMAWPVIGNYLVWQGGSKTNVRVQTTQWWMDDSQPPLKKT
jgi:peptide/nickel transport system substrate-binding protein